MCSPHDDWTSPIGFPHSDISGLSPLAGSPELIAGWRVLHRLRMPRHPPWTLLRLAMHPRKALAGIRRRNQARSGFMCFKFSFDKIKSKSPFLFSDLSLLRFKLEHCPKAPQEGTLELVIFFNQLSVLSMNIGHRVPAPKRFFRFAFFPPVSF